MTNTVWSTAWQRGQRRCFYDDSDLVMCIQLARDSMTNTVWSTAWQRGQRRCFYDDSDLVMWIQLAPLSRSWIRHFTWLSLVDGFKQAANSVDKISKKFTGTSDHRKFLNRCGFFSTRSSQCNEKCVDRSNVSAWRCSVTGRCNYIYNNNHEACTDCGRKMCRLADYFEDRKTVSWSWLQGG